MPIIGFNKGQEIPYAPVYGGNRNSEDPCIIVLRYVPHSRVQEYSSLIAARAKHAQGRDKVVEIAQEVQRKQFLDNVVSASGFLVNGKEIKTPEEILEHGPAELIHELIIAMESSAKLQQGFVRKEG